MASPIAAGLLMCRIYNSELQYFLVHPGGPFYTNKNEGIWSIPKGIPEEKEELIATARREFFEETGIKVIPPLMDIGSTKQKGGKVVYAWTFLGEWNPEDGITCNHFSLEWPPRSGKQVEFPEVDKANWMAYPEASSLINPAQVIFLDRAKEVHRVS